MRVALIALLVVPAPLAAAMVPIAGWAGDWLDDSPLLLLGLPAAVSAVITFLTCRRRGLRHGVRVAWSVASALAACVWFGIFFVAAVAIDCAGRESGSCS